MQRIADEIEDLSRTVLADLRAMVHELRPSTSAQLGLEEAVRALVESTGNRTGLRFDLLVGDGLGDVGSELAEDAYRIVAEAIHNVVKHAEAGAVTVRLGVRDHVLTVDGGGRRPRPARGPCGRRYGPVRRVRADEHAGARRTVGRHAAGPAAIPEGHIGAGGHPAPRLGPPRAGRCPRFMK